MHQHTPFLCYSYQQFYYFSLQTSEFPWRPVGASFWLPPVGGGWEAVLHWDYRHGTVQRGQQETTTSVRLIDCYTGEWTAIAINKQWKVIDRPDCKSSISFLLLKAILFLCLEGVQYCMVQLKALLSKRTLLWINWGMWNMKGLHK